MAPRAAFRDVAPFDFDDDDDPGFDPPADSRPNATETRHIVTEMRANERAEHERIAAEMRAEGINPDTGAPLGTPGEARQASRRPGSARSTLASVLPSPRTRASLAAGALGLVAYAAGVNYLRGGWPQVKGWAAAKFANASWHPASNAPVVHLRSATSSSSVSAPGAVA